MAKIFVTLSEYIFTHPPLLYFFISFIILVIYSISKPFIKLLIQTRSTMFLSFLMVSFFLFLLLLTVNETPYVKEFQKNVFQVILHCLIGFASFLFLRRIYLQIINRNV